MFHLRALMAFVVYMPCDLKKNLNKNVYIARFKKK
jgi:hypothetical protein